MLTFERSAAEIHLSVPLQPLSPLQANSAAPLSVNFTPSIVMVQSLPGQKGHVKTHRSGEWPKNTTVRILLCARILIEFGPQCPGSINLTLLEGATMSRHEEGIWKIVGVFMIVCSILAALIMVM